MDKHFFFLLLQKKTAKEIVECLLNGIPHGTKYPENVRSFALTLHHQSPSAYRFVRETFSKNLPDVSTMRLWYQNCDLNCKPGIHKSILELLQKKAAKLKSKGKQLVCSLSFDEMHIRRQLKWSDSEKKLLGYVSYGWKKDAALPDEMPPLATNVIVFMISSLSENFQLPIAYEFITNLDGQGKKELVVSVINALINVDVKVSNITFDGCTSNKSMCNLLGTDLDPTSEQFQTYFYVGGQKIYVIFDACHMEKLVRSALGDKKTMFDKHDKKIEWQNFVDLVEFRKKGFALTHKMNQKHLYFHRRRMKVDLATQTLSTSVADSMQYLKDQGFVKFENAGALIHFIRKFDTLFDIFNTKSSESSNIFKQSLSAKNASNVFGFLETTFDYIKHLKIAEKNDQIKNVLKSSRQTGFVGYLINISSLKQMFEEYVTDSAILTSISTYSLSQDFLEIFFGKNRY